MPGAPWSYYVLGLVVVVVVARAAWQYFVRQQGTKKKASPKVPVASDEQIVARLNGNARQLLQRLAVVNGKPRELATLETVLTGQQDQKQATQQGLELLVSTGCAVKVGVSQYRITQTGLRIQLVLHPKKKGAR